MERSSENRNVLVTGATGRIGQLLQARLPQLGWQVTGCDIRPPEGEIAGIVADITDLDAMTHVTAGMSQVIHLAATPNAKPGWSTVCRLNIEGTRTVLEAARRCGVRRVIFASSIHTVGGLAAGTPLGPGLPAAPSGIYGVSKIAGEALLQVYAAKGGMSCTSVRICAFLERPKDARSLSIWLGFQDCVHLFDRCLADRSSGYRMIWGVSANTRLSIDDPCATAIGYAPTQNAQAYAPDLAGSGVDISVVSAWPLLGGPVAANTEVDFT